MFYPSEKQGNSVNVDATKMNQINKKLLIKYLSLRNLRFSDDHVIIGTIIIEWSSIVLYRILLPIDNNYQCNIDVLNTITLIWDRYSLKCQSCSSQEESSDLNVVDSGRKLEIIFAS